MVGINRLDYVNSDKDWGAFAKKVSDNTGGAYRTLWVENARANKELIRKCGWAAEKLQDAHAGKTAVLLGASPAIMKQINQLKELQRNEDFIFVGISSGIANLLKNGIKPRYMMFADADPKMKRFWEGMDMSQTRDITMIASISVHPELLALWEGPILFFAVWTDEKKTDRKLKKWFSPINGTGDYFFALSSQYNTGAAFAYLVFGCPVLIFVGNELGFATQETTYYPDRKDVKDEWQRKPHIDIYGDMAYTNYMLMSLKLALEDFLGKLPGWFLNATEAGIFGVSSRHGNLPWIHQLPLHMAIAHARSIMKDGSPLTVEKLITQEVA